MSMELVRRALPWLLAILIWGCVLIGCFGLGVSFSNTKWQSKWDKQAFQLAAAKAQAVTIAREEEQRRQSAIDKVRQDAEQQISRAESDALAANAVAAGLHEQARRVAARTNQCAGDPAAAQSGPTVGQPAVVLADLLSRADARAGELAAAYDRARASGLACESAYLSLTIQK